MSGWKAGLLDDGDEWTEMKRAYLLRGAKDVAECFVDDLYEADPTVLEDSELIEVEVISPAGDVTRWEVEWGFSPSFFAVQKDDERRDRTEGGEL